MTILRRNNAGESLHETELVRHFWEMHRETHPQICPPPLPVGRAPTPPPQPTCSSLTAGNRLNRDQSKPVVVDSHVERVSELLFRSPPCSSAVPVFRLLVLQQWDKCKHWSHSHMDTQTEGGLMRDGSLAKHTHTHTPGGICLPTELQVADVTKALSSSHDLLTYSASIIN